MHTRIPSPSLLRWLTGFGLILAVAQTSQHGYAAEVTNAQPSTASGTSTPSAAVKTQPSAASGTSTPNAAVNAGAAASQTPSGTSTPKGAASSGVVTSPSASDTARPVAASKAEIEAQAEKAFREGLALMRTDECPKALERFNESHRLDPSAASLINVAICHERLGKTAAAWRTFVQAIDAAVSEGSTELRSQAAAALSKLGPILTRVRIVIARPTEAQRVLVNGEPVSDFRDPVPVDPGTSVIEVVAPGRKPWRMTVRADRMGSVFVVEVPELEPAAGAKRVERADLRPAALALGGVGVIGLAVGAVWAVRAKASNDRANDEGTCTSTHCNEVGNKFRDEAWDRARVATWATVLGAAAVGGGAVLWVLSPSNTEKAPVAIGPWLDPKYGVGGFSVRGQL